MFGRLVPREMKFFEHFKKSAALIFEGSLQFQKMFDDLSHAETYARKIEHLEDQTDQVTHHIIELLHTTFITPLDREDIHLLISRLDDIIDFMEDAAWRTHLYGIKSVSPEAKEMAGICVKACELVCVIADLLENLKNAPQIIQTCAEINRLESEADRLLRMSLAKLFEEENDIKTLLKLKEIYELLEIVTDRCEDVSNIVEGIVLEHS